MEPLTLPIRKLIEAVQAGQVRVPAFQRAFVWEPERVAQFIDSIYKQYPFGSLLFWRAHEPLESERDLGPYKLPVPGADYPIDYVLDGQQRVTSIFATFQTDLPRPAETDWMDIYFDYRSDVDPQDSSFFALAAKDADPDRFFPMSVLFDSVNYREATSRVDAQFVPIIDDLQSRIKETLLPIQLLRTDDRATVAIVFERINHQGVPLDTLQLLTAWTWSDDFDLQQRFDDLREALDEHGFAAVGEDTSLVLRCCSAILTGSSRMEALIGLNGSEVRERFSEVENGIRGAVDFLRQQIGVRSLKVMPYPAMLIPLAVYFATEGTELKHVPASDLARLKRWFWRSCFAERYSGQTVRVTEVDSNEVRKMRDEQDNDLGDFSSSVDVSFFRDNLFRFGSAKTATFVLLLASCKPKSFLSGGEVSLDKVLQDYNRHEFHHMFPQAVLKDWEVPAKDISCLANLCFLSRADNNKIRRRPPSEYRSMMPTDAILQGILESAVTTELLFEDDFAAFVAQRSEMLAAAAETLLH
jgi:hypothetical protein